MKELRNEGIEEYIHGSYEIRNNEIGNGQALYPLIKCEAIIDQSCGGKGLGWVYCVLGGVPFCTLQCTRQLRRNFRPYRETYGLV